MNAPKDGDLRLDKWLWFARFTKSRSLATKLVGDGSMRVNGAPTQKAHYAVKIGDVLTFPLGPHIRVISIVALGRRRGPAPEAQSLTRISIRRAARHSSGREHAVRGTRGGGGPPHQARWRAGSRSSSRASRADRAVEHGSRADDAGCGRRAQLHG